MEQKLDPQELQQIKDTQSQQQSLVEQFGQLEYQIQSLELQKETLVESLDKLRIKETELAKNLTNKYGDGVINIENGTFSNQT